LLPNSPFRPILSVKIWLLRTDKLKNSVLFSKALKAPNTQFLGCDLDHPGEMGEKGSHITGGNQRGLFVNKPALLVGGLFAVYAGLI
jgi:hypothetical protein